MDRACCNSCGKDIKCPCGFCGEAAVVCMGCYEQIAQYQALRARLAEAEKDLKDMDQAWQDERESNRLLTDKALRLEARVRELERLVTRLWRGEVGECIEHGGVGDCGCDDFQSSRGFHEAMEAAAKVANGERTESAGD